MVDLLVGHPATCGAVAALLGCDGAWQPYAASPVHPEAGELPAGHPAATEAVVALLASS